MSTLQEPHLDQRTFSALSGATRVHFIVGDPIAQVRSPAGVTTALRDKGLDAIVVPAHVAPENLAAFVDGASRIQNVDGIIVTVPHKFSARDLCLSVSDEAEFLGAVNIMRRRPDGRWHGGMFDGDGFVAALRTAGCELQGRRALLVGAGGAGSAIAYALLKSGVAALVICDTDQARAQSLVKRLASLGKTDVSQAEADPHGFDIAVNASPAGMRANDALPLMTNRLQATTFVGDAVTKPAITPLIEAARARGCVTVTGGQMFGQVCDCIVEFLLAASKPV